MSEAGVVAIFEKHPIQMGAESEKAGRPIFRDVEHVRILIPGDNRTEVFREVTENDKTRFAEEYAAFRNGIAGAGQISGTPLNQWTALTPAEVKGFEAIGILTVEHLADMSDHVKQRVGMGANEYQAKAKAYLASAKDSSTATRMAAENERYKVEIEDLRRQVAELAAMVEASKAGAPAAVPAADNGNEQMRAEMEEMRRMIAALADAPEKRGPGRPPKAAA